VHLPFFDEDNFRFNFVGHGFVTKSPKAKYIFEEVWENAKCQKMNANPFITKLG
jgi:hypothetical protein